MESSMTDVYAKAGIPMPPSDSEPEFDPAKDESPIQENVMIEAPIDWETRHREETDRQLRLECLKMVQNSPLSSRTREAEKLFKYLKEGPDASLGLFTFVCGTCLWNWTAGSRENGEDALADHMKEEHPDIYKKLYGRG